ncbi:hypothetical protein [Yokenella regensburgei]|uniref:hypothetical protein n=1 Tax=Yokenella regensburgei TaxID=158877 RepID=UPI0014330238|nr:hypothetical protein [Yokenella regensburgei]QIU92592.1 hypothetical protein HEC60_25140 [Yokenella regensburgei]
MTVPNAAPNANSWTEAGNGAYTARYTTKNTGAGLKAELRLPGWSGSAASAPYAITFAAPDRTNSSVATDKTLYRVGDVMTVTVTLKDAQGRSVTRASSSLTADTVTVPNAAPKDNSWTEAGNGAYTARYTTINSGTDLKAELRLPGWSGARRRRRTPSRASCPTGRTRPSRRTKPSTPSATS